MTFYPSVLLQCGIGKESTFGTAVAPSVFWPLSSIVPTDRAAPLPDASWRASPSTSAGHTLGPLDSLVTMIGPVYVDSIGFPLAGLLGDVAFASGSPNTWTMSVLNTGTTQPPSYTVTSSDPVGALRWPGCKFASLTFNLDAGSLATFTATAQGLTAVPVSPYAGTPGSLLPFAGWRGVVTLGGSIDTQVVSCVVTVSRAVDPKRNTNGTQAPWLQRSAGLTVTGTATVVMSSDAYRAALAAGTTTSVDVTIAQGAGAGLQSIKLHSSLATYTAAARTYGAQYVEVGLTWIADANTTDAGASGGISPIKATLRNTVGSGTYA